jgi:hypothetical protein
MGPALSGSIDSWTHQKTGSYECEMRLSNIRLFGKGTQRPQSPTLAKLEEYIRKVFEITSFD